MAATLLLGVALGLDSFRVGIALGALPSRIRAPAVALAFGLCDGIAPLVGAVVGEGISTLLGPSLDLLGPAVIAAYGLYLAATALWSPDSEVPAASWLFLGLPLTLSVDNLVVGVGAGAAGIPILLTAVVLGGISGLMAYLGLRLGSAARARVRLDTRLVAGLLLVFVAATLVVDLA